MAAVLVWDDAAQEWVPDATPVPVYHWPSMNSEAQIEMMQRLGPDPTARGGFVAYASWLKLINPPAPQRDPRD